ncbi:MAG: helix-turn-helix domain-containing protein [Pseudomonadota bacterium]
MTLTAGDMLREARLAHGVQLDMLAAALKVPAKKLQALEDNDIEALPDPVFARALAASVCRALHVDAAPVLAKLPGVIRPGLAEQDRAISTGFRPGLPRRTSRNSSSGLPSRVLLTVVVLLLIGAAALFWLPPTAFERIGSSISHFTSRDTASVPAVAETTGDIPPPGTIVEPVAAAVPMPPASASVPAATVPSAVAAAAAPSMSPVSTDILAFAVRDETWVAVSEAGGKQLMSRTLRAGEKVALSGALPLAVVVGRASGVDVSVRGAPFDLTPFAKAGGVARFEVKP